MQENRRRRRSILSREGRSAPSNDGDVENKLPDPRPNESGTISPSAESRNLPHASDSEIPVPGPDATPEELAEYCDRLEAQTEEQNEASGLNARLWESYDDYIKERLPRAKKQNPKR